MCDIGTMIQAGAGIIEKKAEIDENNRKSAANRQSAIASYNGEQDAEQQRYRDANYAAVESAYELHLSNKADLAKATNQAADSGVYGISINEGFFAIVNKGGREDNRFYKELESRRTQFGLDLASLHAKTHGQINSAPQDNSSPLSGALPAIGNAASNGKFDQYLA